MLPIAFARREKVVVMAILLADLVSLVLHRFRIVVVDPDHLGNIGLDIDRQRIVAVEMMREAGARARPVGTAI